MKASYRQLLGEHEMIERAARDLLSDLGNDRADAASLSKQLDELARVVEGHIKVEDAVISDFDADRLTGPWTAAWVDGMAAFDRLKADWTIYLRVWDRAAIERDGNGFRSASETILPRLRERIQMETTAFYATALQTGAIELR